MDKGYIAPEPALRKLRAANGLGQTVYICDSRRKAEQIIDRWKNPRHPGGRGKKGGES